jgi:GntR family transcriptional regulator
VKPPPTPSPSEPIHEQLAQQVRLRLLAGEWPPETALPSIRRLAQQQQVSPVTVQKAYDLLIREGLLQARPAKGFYPIPISPQQQRQKAIQRLRQQLEPLIREASAAGLSRSQLRQTVIRAVENR